MRETIRTILYATDLAPEAGQACGVVLQLTRGLNAELHVLHVLQPALVEGAIEASTEDATSDDAQTEAAQQIHAQLERMQGAGDGNTATLAKSIQVVSGVTSETILLSAEALDADLIVVGARRRGFLARLVTTPTWRGLVERTTAALMIVPLREDEDD